MEIDCHFGRLGDAETTDAIAFNCSPSQWKLKHLFLGCQIFSETENGSSTLKAYKH